MTSAKKEAKMKSMQNLPHCPPVHPPKQNQKDSAKALLRAIQNQWTCLQILEALVGLSMPGCLWLAVRRMSLESESSAGGLWELSWGCKNKKENSKLQPLLGLLTCWVQFKAMVAPMVFNGPKWFNESGHSLMGHLGTGLPICKLAGFPSCSVEQ